MATVRHLARGDLLDLPSPCSDDDSTVSAGMSRVRPVVLGAATTILSVVPLVQDAFWESMALTIMFGLAVGTILTMVLVPVFYATFYNIKSPINK